MEKEIIKRETMERFLSECAVPKKTKNDRLYDCIWRAHRDVMVARRRQDIFVEYYKVHKDIIEKLHTFIRNTTKALTSNLLFDALSIFDVEFGAKQKIINMTLKYIVILNTYGELNIPVLEEECDCPIDSRILSCKKVNRPYIKWTSPKFDKEVYEEIKEIISKDDIGGESGLKFDFENWNNS
ncbi:MAG: hypothetical protein IJR70_00855 [Eubacterium sp.]|nr:hypothetical protein [Eubacterium sp.]